VPGPASSFSLNPYGGDVQQEGPLLQVTDLRKHFPLRKSSLLKSAARIRAVDGVDFEVQQGRTLGLVGESGCGKSTLARLVLKLLPCDSGRILYRGRDVARLSERRFKPLRKEMQIVFQDPHGSLNPKMTVGGAVEDGLRVAGLPRRARARRIKQLLDMVGLPFESRKRYPHEFSGGQLQRIGLARALSVDPSLILCDEPVSALDVSIQAQIINLLQHLQQELGLAYLFISHDLNVVGYLSDRVAVMYMGEIVEYAPAGEVFARALHPYTRALLAAVPGTDPDQGSMRVISGEVESAVHPPQGCRFGNRCAWVEETCNRERQELVRAGPEHTVRCWKWSSLR
jgi:oligopeptide/dipeptide ABC transporter ATP-binding protein